MPRHEQAVLQRLPGHGRNSAVLQFFGTDHLEWASCMRVDKQLFSFSNLLSYVAHTFPALCEFLTACVSRSLVRLLANFMGYYEDPFLQSLLATRAIPCCCRTCLSRGRYRLWMGIFACLRCFHSKLILARPPWYVLSSSYQKMDFCRCCHVTEAVILEGLRGTYPWAHPSD